MTDRDALLARLRAGAGPADGGLRSSLAPSGDDRTLAAELLHRIASEAEPKLARAEPEPERRTSGPPAGGADSSFLSRLGAGGRDVGDIDEIDTLFGILEGGALAQRRAAARRIQARIESGHLTPEELERVETTLAAPRDPDVAWEITRARAALPGAAGREVRDEAEAFAELVRGIEASVRAFWEEDRSEEPILALGAAEVASLAMRARELPDAVIAHVAALLDGSTTLDLAARTRLTAALRSAADARLVPTLAMLAADRSPELAREAVRALGRIEDPRVRPVLARAFDRSGDQVTRALAAGSLGLSSDARGLASLREMIDGGDRAVQRAAVEGIVELATMEDVDRLVRLLAKGDGALLAHTVRALGRIGDGRAVVPLRARAAQDARPALAEEIAVALRSIAAQMELRGEGAPPTVAIVSRKALRPTDRTGIGARFVAALDVLLGRAWLLVGAVERALAAFEAAATRRPGWAPPHAAIALAQVRRGRAAPALAAFRRALSSDRGYVETQTRLVRSLARTFLRRAEEMERTGRRDIALGLLEEVVALDLRRVDPPVRFEITRRADRLRAEVSSA
jgi:HEAT repeat protein